MLTAVIAIQTDQFLFVLFLKNTLFWMSVATSPQMQPTNASLFASQPQNMPGDINSSSTAYKQVRQIATETQQKLASDDLPTSKKDTSDLEIITSVDAEEKAARETAD